MKIKTSELARIALNWAVAKCEYPDDEDDELACLVTEGSGDSDGWVFNPSTDWSQGGPIIEREGINLRLPRKPKGSRGVPTAWVDVDNNGNDIFLTGNTPLEAAMRCYVASKLGDEVDIPEELL